MNAAPSPHSAERLAPVPCVRLFTDRVLAEDRRSRSGYEYVTLPVIALWFDYGGLRVVPDDRQDDLAPDSDELDDDEPASSRPGAAGAARAPLPRVEVPVFRDRLAEASAQALLESFGAVDLSCVDHLLPGSESEANYLVQADPELHALCSFSQHAVPTLRARGFRVEIDPAYPYQVLDAEPRFVASLDRADGDWFTLELGVDTAGGRIDLLPGLLELIAESGTDDVLEDLARVTGRYRAVPAGDGRYLCLPPERLERLLRVLIELYGGDPPPAPAPLPCADAAALLDLDAALTVDGSLTWEGDDEPLRRQRALRTAPRPSPPPECLPVTLRPYQQEGLDWLDHLREHELNGVLADDMGLGKTLQTIAHLMREVEQGRAELPSLIVVPTSLVGNWQRELGRFAPALSRVVLHGAARHAQWARAREAHVVITTYAVLVRDVERLAELEFHYVVLDEAQAIKNERSLSKRAASRLEARHRLCLTGTPVENDLDELWSLMDFLNPGWLGDAASFRRRFRFPIEREDDQEALASLRSRIAPLVLRRTKQGVVRELPAKTQLVQPVELFPEQRDLYEDLRVSAHAEVRRAIRKKGLAASSVVILDALMKLRQACCDPRLVAVAGAREVRRSAKTEAFIELTVRLLAEGHRVLVFSQFARMLLLLSAELRQAGVDSALLTGATADRQGAVDRFERGDVDVFLISLKAGGTGLNLVSADTVVHFDPWWNFAAQAQATDRAYRIGQTRPVFVHHLIVAGSVEERLLGLQERKRRLMESLLSEGTGGAPALTEDDVESLLAPLDAEDEAQSA